MLDVSPDSLKADPKELAYVDSASGTITPMAAGTEPASDKDLPTIDVGKATSLIALASFGSSVVQDVSEAALWTGADPSIAVVSNVKPGHVTGVKAGKVKIKASYKTQSGELEITVK